MKKKLNVLLLIIAVLITVVLVWFLIYLFTDKLEIPLHYLFHPEDFQGVTVGFEGLPKILIISTFIFLCIVGILVLDILALISLNKSELKKNE